MNSLKSTRCVLTILLVMFLRPATIFACTPILPPNEYEIWQTHYCSDSFRSWVRSYFNLQEDHWDGGWGWGNCDWHVEFGKMIDSAVLLRFSLEDDVQGPWHSNVDYSAWAAGSAHDFRYEPRDVTGNAYAKAFSGWFQINHVELYCPFFDQNAASRAGIMLHEATHIIYDELDHQANIPPDNCVNENNEPEPCSDNWFFHYLLAYDYGQLGGHKHSMNQIQVEFLCDVYTHPDPRIPIDLAEYAGAESMYFMTYRILNPPGWVCGEPRPTPPPPTCPVGWTCCDEPDCTECVPPGASCQ